MERMVRSLALLFLASDIQTSLRNGSRACGIYALRISRSFLQFQPPATKDRFSDDNPLIRCTLHCFSIFPSLSPSVSIFFFFQRQKLLPANIIFVPGTGCVHVCVFLSILERRKRGTTLSRRGGKKSGKMVGGRRAKG